MPQMDSATYLGQVTWFAVVFAVFYLIVLTDVLPGLNRALKVRTKKIERVRGDARQFDGVRVSAQDALDSHVGGVSRMISRITGERAALSQSYSRALIALRMIMRKRNKSTAAGSATGASGNAVAARISPLTSAKATAAAAVKASRAKAVAAKSVKSVKGVKNAGTKSTSVKSSVKTDSTKAAATKVTAAADKATAKRGAVRK